MLLLAVCLSCSSPFETTCTLIGCIGTLTIAFDAAPADGYHIEAYSVSDGVRQFDCANPAQCPVVRLSDYTPGKVIITVRTTRGSRQYNLSPEYENVYANGRRCGVTCRSATVTLSLP